MKQTSERGRHEHPVIPPSPIDCGSGRRLLVPRPQILSRQYLTGPGGERIRLRLSIGTLEIQGRGIRPLLERLAGKSEEASSFGQDGVTAIVLKDHDDFGSGDGPNQSGSPEAPKS